MIFFCNDYSLSIDIKRYCLKIIFYLEHRHESGEGRQPPDGRRC